MFSDINNKYSTAVRAAQDDKFILESVTEDDLDMDVDVDDAEIVDSDSVPTTVMSQIDKQLDTIISSKDFDDAEIEEMIDEDDDDASDVTLTEGATIGQRISHMLNEAAGGAWYDDEGIHHPNVAKRTPTNGQPKFGATGSLKELRDLVQG